MIKAPIYTIKGTKTGELTLPKEMFEVKPNLNLLAQAIYVYEERSHVGLRQAKTRSEVNRTTKKVYKQKGTGGARHGSRRAPIYVGGGVAHGPRAVRRELSLSGGIKAKVKTYAFSVKAGEKEIVAVSGISKVAKTKEVAEFLKKLAAEFKTQRFTFILSDKSKSAIKFIRNLGNANAIFYSQADALSIWKGGILVLDEGVFEKEKPVKEVVKKEVAKKTVKKVAKKAVRATK